jgi:superfamily II DNA/RNA helicase
MLDMGFIPDIEEICTKLPGNRQTLLFSATMPGPIKKLADKFLTNPKQIEVARPATANTSIEQRLVEVSSRGKRAKLISLLHVDDVSNAIIFSNRKTTVRELAQILQREGFAASQIHGDMSQPERVRELDRFKNGEITILVASDVAARGLDIKGVSHIFNYDVPWHPDDYIHRIGRTGRAGATGKAFTLATPDDAEAVEAIEKLTGMKIERTESSARTSAPEEPAEPREAAPRAPRGRGRKSERPAPTSAPAPVVAAPILAKAPEPRTRQPERVRAPEKARAPEREPADDGGWTGPVPSFLDVSFGTSPHE